MSAHKPGPCWLAFCPECGQYEGRPVPRKSDVLRVHFCTFDAPSQVGLVPVRVAPIAEPGAT